MDEKKEAGQYNTQETCNEAVEEEPFSVWLFFEHLSKKFCHLEDEGKETGQYNTEETCNKSVEEDPLTSLYVPDHFKTQGICIEAVDIEPILLAWVPDHFKTRNVQQSRWKKKHGCCGMFLIILKHRKCATM